jgi:membrane associated rhomboid family serine protease
MVFGPVGIRCPECAGVPTGARRTAERVRKVGDRAPATIVTTVLIAVNVVVFLAEIALGSSWDTTSGRIFNEGALFGPFVADGEWYRLITSAFLHAGPIHLLFNMLALWWFGRPLESYLGSARYLGLYFVSALAGAAGALLLSPTTPTVGASGAVFGILGAGLVLERRRIYVFGGAALLIVAFNLVFTFTFGSISIGGHIGGLLGGIVSMLALSHWRTGWAGYAALVGVAIVSVAIAYARVRGLG